MINPFPYRFPNKDIRKRFKLHAVQADKSMNKLITELITEFLEKKEEITQ